MPHSLVTYIYVAGVVAATAIRIAYTRHIDKRKVRNIQPVVDRILTTLTGIGMLIIPVIYLATPWLNQFSYQIPVWLSLVGMSFFIAAILLLWQSHAALGKNWTPTIVPGVKQHFIRHGIYQTMRHPMYSAYLAWAIAQPVLLPNWIAGWAFLILSIPLYIYRIPREESLLCAQFGEEYTSYQKETGCLWPHF